MYFICQCWCSYSVALLLDEHHRHFKSSVLFFNMLNSHKIKIKNRIQNVINNILKKRWKVVHFFLQKKKTLILVVLSIFKLN